jgi:heavy metal sensor kinase
VIGGRPSIRLKLTWWYSAALACVLAVYAAVVLTVFQHDLWQQLTALLHEDTEHVVTEVEGGGPDPLSEDDEWVEVWSNGHVLFKSPSAKKRPLPSLPPPSGGFLVTVKAPDDGEYLRVQDTADAIGGVPMLLRVAEEEEPVREHLDTLFWIMGLGLPITVLIAAFAGYHLAKRALAPVNEMAARARAISADNLGERLPVANPGDEVGQLAVVINDLLARLERSFVAMKRFTSDASHELRTPLTAIRTVGEVGLRNEGGGDEYRETIGSMLEDVGRLTHLVEAMLMLSRAEAGRIPVAREDGSVTEFVEEVAAQLNVLAEEKNQAITVSASGSTRARIDPIVLRMALVNLVDNAIRYSPRGAKIDVTVRERDSAVEVAVRDYGPGIAAEHQQRLFERFYRVDDARSRQDGGAGLGLSIAKWAVEAHDGRLDVSSQPGSGSVFTMTLPRA